VPPAAKADRGFKAAFDRLKRISMCGYQFMRYLFIVCAALSLASGCSDSGKPIRFVLPNDFKGEFCVVKDSVNGADLTERNGEWVFEIPPDGVLKVKNDRPLYRWHAQSASYADGREVACDDLGTRAGARSTGPNSSESSTNFDGTTHTWRVR
jgi:hypothetical protein